VTGKQEGYTENSIFLPATGYRDRTTMYDVGRIGYYWSSSLTNADYRYAVDMEIQSGNFGYSTFY